MTLLHRERWVYGIPAKLNASDPYSVVKASYGPNVKEATHDFHTRRQDRIVKEGEVLTTRKRGGVKIEPLRIVEENRVLCVFPGHHEQWVNKDNIIATKRE
jgi:hypothetical protein